MDLAYIRAEAEVFVAHDPAAALHRHGDQVVVSIGAPAGVDMAAVTADMVAFSAGFLTELETLAA